MCDRVGNTPVGGPAKQGPTCTIGLCRSRDGGATWDPISTPFSRSRELDGIPGSFSGGELVEAQQGWLMLLTTWFDRSDPSRLTGKQDNYEITPYDHRGVWLFGDMAMSIYTHRNTPNTSVGDAIDPRECVHSQLMPCSVHRRPRERTCRRSQHASRRGQRAIRRRPCRFLQRHDRSSPLAGDFYDGQGRSRAEAVVTLKIESIRPKHNWAHVN